MPNKPQMSKYYGMITSQNCFINAQRCPLLQITSTRRRGVLFQTPRRQILICAGV